MLMLAMLSTPAPIFLSARGKNKTLLFNPRDDRTARFISAKKVGSLAYSKGAGFYNIDPKDVYIEQSSRTPIIQVHDLNALSINIDQVELVNELKKIGYDNYNDLVAHYNRWFNEAQAVETAMLKAKASGEDYNGPPLPDAPSIEIKGESVTLSNVIAYLGSNERSDVIEAQIDRATAAVAARKAGVGGDIMKWAAIIALIVVAGAIAYVIVMSYAGDSGAIDYNRLAQAFQQVNRNDGQPNVVTGDTPQSGTVLS